MAKKYHPDLNPGDAEAARKMQEINAAYEQIQNPGQRNTSYDQMQHSTNSYQSGGYQYKGYGTGQQEQEYGDFDPLEIFSHWSNYRSTKRRPIFLYILIGYLLLNLLFSLLGGGRTRQEYYYPYRYSQIEPTLPEEFRQEGNSEYQYPYYWWGQPPADGE